MQTKQAIHRLYNIPIPFSHDITCTQAVHYLNEGFDLPKDQVPLHLVVRLIGPCVVINLLGQLLQQDKAQGFMSAALYMRGQLLQQDKAQGFMSAALYMRGQLLQQGKAQGFMSAALYMRGQLLQQGKAQGFMPAALCTRLSGCGDT